MRDGWPDWKVEAGFTPADVAVTATAFILDDTSRGKLGTGTLVAGTTWTDISPWVQEFTTERPGSRQQGPVVTYEASTCTVTLTNSDARFTPGNLSGPYTGGGVTQVRPMIPLRISATWQGVTYPLFTGFVTSWVPPAEWTGPYYAVTVASASDAFRVLEGTRLAETAPAGGGELSGQRVNRILNSANWYDPAYGGTRSIGTGVSHVQATAYGDTALALIQLTVLTELGEFYIDGGGGAVFRDRLALESDTRSNTVQAVFSDSSGGGYGPTYGPTYTGAAVPGLPYTALSNPTDDTTMANVVQATRDGGNLQEVTDVASVSKYLFPRVYAADGLLLLSDADALNWATYVLYLAKNDETRFDELTVNPVNWPDELWPHALGRELGDRIEVSRTPPGMGSPLTQDVFIRGITHTVTIDEWVTVWTLQDAARYGGAPDFSGNASAFLVLDHATLGQLDSSALSF